MIMALYLITNIKNNILKISINNIKKEFNKKGIILFRNFDFNIENIGQFTINLQLLMLMMH